MTISFEAGGAYLRRRPILMPGDDTQVVHPCAPVAWVCPVHLSLDNRPREFVADVLVDYDLGETAVKSRAFQLCVLLNAAVSTMERGPLLAVLAALAPFAVGKIINDMVKSREVRVANPAV
jgi:hypothetical protein